MSTHDISTQSSITTVAQERRRFYISGLMLRVLIALVISWLIVMAFFVTGAGSH